jgi:hypothetical protein
LIPLNSYQPVGTIHSKSADFILLSVPFFLLYLHPKRIQ